MILQRVCLCMYVNAAARICVHVMRRAGNCNRGQSVCSYTLARWQLHDAYKLRATNIQLHVGVCSYTRLGFSCTTKWWQLHAVGAQCVVARVDVHEHACMMCVRALICAHACAVVPDSRVTKHLCAGTSAQQWHPHAHVLKRFGFEAPRPQAAWR
eukprot:5919731-Pyramimonas_sp.AAC.2